MSYVKTTFSFADRSYLQSRNSVDFQNWVTPYINSYLFPTCKFKSRGVEACLQERTADVRRIHSQSVHRVTGHCQSTGGQASVCKQDHLAHFGETTPRDGWTAHTPGRLVCTPNLSLTAMRHAPINEVAYHVHSPP